MCYSEGDDPQDHRQNGRRTQAGEGTEGFFATAAGVDRERRLGDDSAGAVAAAAGVRVEEAQIDPK